MGDNAYKIFQYLNNSFNDITANIAIPQLFIYRFQSNMFSFFHLGEIKHETVPTLKEAA